MEPSSLRVVLYSLLGFFALVVALVVWAYRAGKRREEEQRRRDREFGFHEAPERAADLDGRMKTLHHHWGERHGVQEVKRKSEWGYELLRFDLKEPSGNSSQLTLHQTVLISPDLKLPRFTLFPRMQGAGITAAMTNKALAWVGSQFPVHPAFPDSPAFDAKYMIWGNDEGALREFFTPARLARLAETEELQVEGDGDALHFSRVPFARLKQTYAEKLQEVLHNARTLHDIFKD